MLLLGVIRVADTLHGSACRLTAGSHNRSEQARTLKVNYYAILARPRRTILVSRSHRHNLGVVPNQLDGHDRARRRGERGARSRNGSIDELTGVLRYPAAALMIPGAAGASVPRIGPRPQSLRLSDTPGRDLWVSMTSATDYCTVSYY